MKLLLVSIVLLMSFSASAEVPEVWAKNVTCKELKRTLANYGSVKVNWSMLGYTTSLIVHESVDCHADQAEVSGVFVTKDTLSCVAGRYCLYTPSPRQ